MVRGFIEFIIDMFTSQLPKAERRWSLRNKVTATIAIAWAILAIAFMVFLGFFKDYIDLGYGP